MRRRFEKKPAAEGKKVIIVGKKEQKESDLQKLPTVLLPCIFKYLEVHECSLIRQLNQYFHHILERPLFSLQVFLLRNAHSLRMLELFIPQPFSISSEIETAGRTNHSFSVDVLGKIFNLPEEGDIEKSRKTLDELKVFLDDNKREVEEKSGKDRQASRDREILQVLVRARSLISHLEVLRKEYLWMAREGGFIQRPPRHVFEFLFRGGSFSLRWASLVKAHQPPSNVGNADQTPRQISMTAIAVMIVFSLRVLTTIAFQPGPSPSLYEWLRLLFILSLMVFVAGVGPFVPKNVRLFQLRRKMHIYHLHELTLDLQKRLVHHTRTGRNYLSLLPPPRAMALEDPSTPLPSELTARR